MVLSADTVALGFVYARRALHFIAELDKDLTFTTAVQASKLHAHDPAFSTEYTYIQFSTDPILLLHFYKGYSALVSRIWKPHSSTAPRLFFSAPPSPSNPFQDLFSLLGMPIASSYSQTELIVILNTVVILRPTYPPRLRPLRFVCQYIIDKGEVPVMYWCNTSANF